MKKIRILLVEDDEVDQMAFKRLVIEEKLPCYYVVAGSILEAKKILENNQFDAAVLDFSLGDGTSFDLFGLLKDTPLIITTGVGNEEVAVKAMKMGAFDYLIKDVDRKYLNILPITIENAVEYKKAKKQNVLLSHAVKSVSDSIYIIDMDYKFIFVNKALCETYKYKEEEILGKHLSILWKKESLYQKYLDGTKNIKGDWQGELYTKRKDDSEFPVSVTRSIIRDENGNEIAICGIIRDITVRKEAELEREKFISELKRYIADVKTLWGLLPICGSCKKVRDDKGYWKQVEDYFKEHSNVTIAHGLCPDCAKKSYPELDSKIFDDVFKEK